MMTKRICFEKYSVVKIAGIMILTIAVFWCVIGIKANAAERADNDKTKYQIQEVQLKNEIRASLEEMGYFNSGITITKIMDANGSREYTVLVHHQYLEAEDTDKVNAVYESLWALDVEGDNMTVNYTIF